MNQIIVFIMSYILVLIVYEIFIVSKTKKDKASKKKNFKEIAEVRYLVNRYNVDMDKVNYNGLLHLVAAVSSFDISLTAALMEIPDAFFLKLCVAFVCALASFIASYYLVFRLLKMKGMIKNGK